MILNAKFFHQWDHFAILPPHFFNYFAIRHTLNGPSCKSISSELTYPIMGIHGFTEWFFKNFPKTLQKVGPTRPPADHLLIDFNQFIHNVSRTAPNYAALWKKMYAQLDRLLKMTNPKQSVYIVMDGPGT